MAKQQTKTTTNKKKSPKKRNNSEKRSEFGKTVHHYMIDHDQTLQGIADGAGLKLSTFRLVVNSDAAPPREWMANTSLPDFIREATALHHRERIAGDYQLVRKFFPEFTRVFDALAQEEGEEATEEGEDDASPEGSPDEGEAS